MKYKVKNVKGKYIKTGRDSAYVSFSFGSCAYVGFDRYLGYSRKDCLKLRSDKIDSYVENNKVYKI